MKRLLLSISFLFVLSLSAHAIVIDRLTATALNQVMLYGDSSFVHHSQDIYREGDIFRIIEESKQQHPDADQKQKFKWYKVETSEGKTGWIFGDGLAVFTQEQDIESVLQPYQKVQISLGKGFEDAVIWIASINGRDNFHANDYMNPIYNENYLVLTNSRGKSTLIKCSGESARGVTKASALQLRDLTGDGYPEIIFQCATQSVGSSVDDRKVEVFSMQAGTLTSIFQEQISLLYEENTPSPSIYKYVVMEEQTIRVSYVDYLSCSKYGQAFDTGAYQARNQRCMEYVTTYHSWDKRLKKFKALYGETRLPIEGITKRGVPLKSSPETSASTAGFVSSSQSINVLKHHESYIMEGGKKKVDNWILVQTMDGKQGYIPAKEIQFKDVEHHELLEEYYTDTPLSKTNWKSDARDFIQVIGW